jgi:predicted protein tyrosine phosphatase
LNTKHPLSANRNRLENVYNRYQGEDTKVLCVCSAGILRSPTLAHILQCRPYNFNCRAVGCDSSHALTILDQAFLEWANLIICVDKWSELTTKHLLIDFDIDKHLIELDLPDIYGRNDPKLVKAIKMQLKGTQDTIAPYLDNHKI